MCACGFRFYIHSRGGVQKKADKGEGEGANLSRGPLLMAVAPGQEIQLQAPARCPVVAVRQRWLALECDGGPERS